MSEMIERAAKAINKAELDWKAANGGDYASVLDCPDEIKARAVIMELREPTESMIEASNREWDGRLSHRSSGAWQAMIDEALK